MHVSRSCHVCCMQIGTSSWRSYTPLMKAACPVRPSIFSDWAAARCACTQGV